MVQVLVQGQNTDDSVQPVRQRENLIFLLLCVLHALNELDNAHAHRGGKSILFNSLLQMLITSGNTLADALRSV